MVIFDPLRPAARTPPRPERRGGPSGGPAGGPQAPLLRAFGGRSGGMVDRRSRPPSRAVLGGEGGPPLPGLAGGGGGPPPLPGLAGGGEAPPPPRASRRGGGPPGEGGLAGVDPQALGPRNRSPGGAPGGLPRGEAPAPRSPPTYRERGVSFGGRPRPVLGPGSSPLDGIPGIRAPGAKKNAIGPGGGPAGDHELRHGARGARVRLSGRWSRRSWAAAAPPGFEFVRSRPSTTSSRPRKTSSATRSGRSMCRSAAFEGGEGRDLVRVTPGEASRGGRLLERSIPRHRRGGPRASMSGP
jgi:hypothetical protein